MSESNELYAAAQTYGEWGWHVFPLQPRSKIPMPGSHGCKDATTKPAIISDWWSKAPNANIGIATGAASNLAVIDLDLNETDGIDGAAEWAKLVERHGPVATAEVRTGGGGRQLYFQHSAGFKNSASKIAAGIDTRGEGGYIVSPPSIHPSGQAYEWAVHPEECGFATLPAWLLPDNLAGLIDQAARPRTAADAAERCRKYLEKIPDAISGQGGHNATLRAACECFRFGLQDSQAWDLLNWYNGAKCRPAWSEQELRHKLTEGRKLVDREGKFGERIKTDIAEAAPRAVSAPASHAPAAIEPFPVDVATLPGLTGDICRWMLSTAYKQQPALILANTLAFLGAVFGRRVRTASDLRTNLYCLGVGESGCGKDHSRRCVKRICDSAKLTGQILGGEEIASDAAIETAISVNPSLLFQLDEIGHMLSQVNSRYAASHQRNISPTLMKFFSSASVLYLGKQYATQDRKQIDQPNVCLYGTTTPARLYSGLSTADISDGFLNRMIVFPSGDADPPERDVEALPVPPNVTKAVQDWHARYQQLPPSEWDAAVRVPITVAANGDAAAILKRFSSECRAKRQEQRDGAGLDSLWARATEHASKLALILACACGEPDAPEEIEIDATSADLATRVIDYLTRAFAEAVGGSVTDSDFGRAIHRVRQVIKSRAGGVKMRQLTKRTEGMLPRVRLDALAELMQSGEVEQDTRREGDRGPEATYYVIRRKAA